MATKIKKLSIDGFRGVRRPLSLDFTSNAYSLVVFGANANGKSSIADAFEWFFTGKIEELRKEGCSKADYRHRLLLDKEDSTVSMEFTQPSHNSRILLKSSLHQEYSNTTTDFKDYLKTSAQELTILRHKDLKRFVDETKGTKRKEFAQLIGMEGWERIREELMGAVHQLDAEYDRHSIRLDERKGEVTQLAGLKQFSLKDCWAFADLQAQKVGISSKIRSLKQLKQTEQATKLTSASRKQIAKLTYLKQVEASLEGKEKLKIETSLFDKFVKQFNRIASNPQIVAIEKLTQLLAIGKDLVEKNAFIKDHCPLCGQEIRSSELLSHINQHREENKEVISSISKFNILRTNLREQVDEISSNIEAVVNLADDESLDFRDLRKSAAKLNLLIASKNINPEKELSPGNTIAFDSTGLKKEFNKLRPIAIKLKDLVRKEVRKHNPSKDEREKINAFQNLHSLADHLGKIQQIDENLKLLKNQLDSLKQVEADFQVFRRKTMGDILKKISTDVNRYFLLLNPNRGFDEISLRFLPDEDGVEFNLRYKGEEISPPRKFLSESYLNGLGICLFLATAMRLNKQNSFVVLDDIVNSFDTNHRADLAALLISELRDLQLIVLTHDLLWFDLLRRLASSGWSFRKIRRWTYEDGVEMEKAEKDALAECISALGGGDVKLASPLIRTYMESKLKDLCAKLGVRVRMRIGSSNDERTAGELLPDLVKYLGDRGFARVDEDNLIRELEASSFIVNYGSHDRSEAVVSLDIADVQFAFNRFQRMLDLFSCPDCKKPLWNTANRDFAMQCKCGKLALG